jgi:outer membrane protein assembly factor BamB
LIDPFTGEHLETAVLAYTTSDGARLWETGLDDHGIEASGRSIVASPDGTQVFVLGRAIDGSQRSGPITAALQASSGSLLWSKDYLDDYGGANSLVVHPDGTAVYIAGHVSDRCCNGDWVTIAYSTS